MIDNTNLFGIVSRAEKVLGDVEYHHPDHHKNIYLYSQGRYMSGTRQLNEPNRSVVEASQAGAMEENSRASGSPMGRGERRLPVHTSSSKRNCGPDRLFGDTDLGLPNDKVSFSSESPRLSRGGLDYSVPAPVSRTPRTPRGEYSKAKIMLDKDGPDSLRRKPLGRGILGEPASVRSRPHPAGPIGYSNLMAKAFENESNAAIKRKRLSLTRKTGLGGQSTSYQKEAVNFAIRSTPPKLKEMPLKAKVQDEQPKLSNEMDCNDDDATACIDTTEHKHRSYNLRSNRGVKVDNILELKYQPEGSKMAVELTTADVETLEPGDFLNDKIMDFYLKYITYERLKVEHRKKLHIFSSFFYTRLCNASMDSKSKILSAGEKMHGRVKTWTRHVDLFSKDFIVMPICDKSHWYVVLVQKPGEFDHIAAAPAPPPAREKQRGRRSSRVYKKTEASVSHLKEERNRSEEFVMETSNDGVQGRLQGTQASPFISKTDSLSAGDPLHMKVYEEEMDQDENEEIRRDLPGDDVPVLSSSSTREHSPVASSTSSGSSTSYYSCSSNSRRIMDKLREDGISMWAGSPSASDARSNTLSPDHSDSPPLVLLADDPGSQSVSTSSSLACTQSPYFSTTPPRTSSASISSSSSDVVLVPSSGGERDQPRAIEEKVEVEESVDIEEEVEGGRSVEIDVEVEVEGSVEIEEKEKVGRSVEVDPHPAETPLLVQDEDDHLLGNSDLPSSLLAQSSMTDSKEIVKVKEEVEEDSSIMQPCIMVLDSLGIKRPSTVRKVRMYLSQEWIVKKDESVDGKFEHLPVHYPKIPLQHNSSDCGIYVLQFVETLVQCLNTSRPLPSTTDEWGTAKVVNKRSKIRDLIVELKSSNVN